MEKFYGDLGFKDIADSIQSYSPLVMPGHEQRPSTGIALLSTHYRWAKNTKSYSNQKMARPMSIQTIST